MKWINYNGDPTQVKDLFPLRDYWSRKLLTSLLLTNTSPRDRSSQLAGTDRQAV